MLSKFSFKSAAKAVLWRLIASFITTFLTLCFTNDVAVSVGVGSVDLVVKLFVFYFFDKYADKVFDKQIDPTVFWMTGLSGAGKTTLAKAMARILKKWGNKVVILDGDEIRKVFPKTGFDKESRRAHNKRVAFWANKLKEQGIVVIVSLISPYKEFREEAREICGGDFIETYISTPLRICEKRDVKGLYAKARAGEIENFTGLDGPFEAPENADIEINATDGYTVEDCANAILKHAKKK